MKDHIFIKIEFCVAKYWEFNICSFKIQLVTFFMKFSLLIQLINHGSGFWGLIKIQKVTLKMAPKIGIRAIPSKIVFLCCVRYNSYISKTKIAYSKW